MKAIIFAAGLGTRLKPLTDTIPKALVPVSGKPLLEHIILRLISYGFDEIVVNVHHFSKQITDFLKYKNNFGIRIDVSDESSKLLDTGGGIKKAAWFFDDEKPFLVHNVDILSNVNLSDLYTQHERSDALATLLVSRRETSRYLLFDKEMRLKGWMNEKTKETKPPKLDVHFFDKYAFSGVHVLSPRVFQQMQPFDDKFSIIDFYLSIMSEQNIMGYFSDNLKLLDVGKVDSLKEADSFLE